MKQELVPYTTKNGKDIYHITFNYGQYNPVQDGYHYFTKTQNGGDNDTTKYVTEITHSLINGMSNLILSINLPEIKGCGTVSFNPYFGFGLIKELTMTIDNSIVSRMTGYTFLQEYLKYCNKNMGFKNVYEKWMGNDENRFKKKSVPNADLVIFEKKRIDIPLFMFFDNNLPFSTLRVFDNTSVKIELELKPLKSVLNYNTVFRDKSLESIDVLYEPKLKIKQYNTTGEGVCNRMYTQYECTYGSSVQDSINSPLFDSITDLSIYTKSNLFDSGKTFVAYPDSVFDEKSYISCYEKRILKDMIVIAKNIDEFIHLYPKNAIFEEVKDNMINFSSVYKCNIEIVNIPDNMKIFYHKNILTFNRCGGDKEYNISDKFRCIRGIYYQDSKLIDFTKITSILSIGDVSIPIELWTNSSINTSYGDLRSTKSILYDNVHINNPFIFGIDFIGKNTGIEEVRIKSHPIDISSIVEEHSSNPELSMVTNQYNYPYTYSISFNKNDITFIEPAKICSDSKQDFRQFIIHPTYIEFNNNDIRKTIKFDVVVGINTVKELKYNTHQNIITSEDVKMN